MNVYEWKKGKERVYVYIYISCINRKIVPCTFFFLINSKIYFKKFAPPPPPPNKNLAKVWIYIWISWYGSCYTVLFLFCSCWFLFFYCKPMMILISVSVFYCKPYNCPLDRLEFSKNKKEVWKRTKKRNPCHFKKTKKRKKSFILSTYTRLYLQFVSSLSRLSLEAAAVSSADSLSASTYHV